MQKIIGIILLSLLSISANADERDADIHSQIKNEFGSCFDNFTPSLQDCIASVCSYPDLSDSKSWRAQAIKGYYNDTCYVVYYSYVGNQITGSPDHCFYSKFQTRQIIDNYRQLFTTNSNIQAADARARIAKINNFACQKADSNKKTDNNTAKTQPQ